MGKFRSYFEMKQLPTFDERLEYLKLGGKVGRDTFGYSRYLNQKFYASKEWKDFRREIILRDNGCDLGIDDGDHMIYGKILIHHINPIKKEDLLENNFEVLMDPNNAVCVSHLTHEAIHYCNESLIFKYKEREPDDMIPWR